MPNQSFVGRAGQKLNYALVTFGFSVENLTCADFGSAVGGFVDCLLQKGAAKVYAVETGYGVLDWKLRNDPRVIVKERTNAMHVTLPEKMDLITIDASWTKQLSILPNALKNLKTGGHLITLIKPHYEADKSLLIKGKLTPEDAALVTNKVINEIQNQLRLTLINQTISPIVGGKAENTEYLALFSSPA